MKSAAKVEAPPPLGPTNLPRLNVQLPVFQ